MGIKQAGRRQATWGPPMATSLISMLSLCRQDISPTCWQLLQALHLSSRVSQHQVHYARPSPKVLLNKPQQ